MEKGLDTLMCVSKPFLFTQIYAFQDDEGYNKGISGEFVVAFFWNCSIKIKCDSATKNFSWLSGFAQLSGTFGNFVVSPVFWRNIFRKNSYGITVWCLWDNATMRQLIFVRKSTKLCIRRYNERYIKIWKKKRRAEQPKLSCPLGYCFIMVISLWVENFFRVRWRYNFCCTFSGLKLLLCTL